MGFSLNKVLLTVLAITLPALVEGQSTLGFRGGLGISSLGGEDAVTCSIPRYRCSCAFSRSPAICNKAAAPILRRWAFCRPGLWQRSTPPLASSLIAP